MSSFRIDRQYVSFETVETPNVHPVEQALSGMQNDYEGSDAYPEGIEKYCTDIISKATEEAEKKAAKIVGRAEHEAGRALDSAKKQAAQIVDEAKSAAEDIETTARTQGYEQGEKDAEAEAAARKNRESQALKEMVGKLKADYCNLVDDMHKDIMSLIIEIARKIINVKLKESDEVFIGLINDGIERLKNTGSLMIHVSSDDYARYFESGRLDKKIEAGEAKVVPVEEETYLPGDLIIESDGEMLNLSIERQIKQIEEILSEEEEK
ncbi:MAG: FliH/SctL family protein [Oscillospiraceae bacterium]